MAPRQRNNSSSGYPTCRSSRHSTLPSPLARPTPEVEGVRSDGFVAGDDSEAKQKVLELVESIGFRPIDAGLLGMARALEAMANLNITLQMSNQWSWQTAWKLVGPTTG